MSDRLPARREFLTTMAGVAGAYAFARPAGTLAAAQARTRRRVTIGGRAIRVIDVHAHCVIPVADVVKGTPLAGQGGGGGNNLLGPRRLEVMDEQGVDVQALSINGYWWYAA
jgi:aminocarboxymuconate-semialdehyde decarboxylase